MDLKQNKKESKLALFSYKLSVVLLIGLITFCVLPFLQVIPFFGKIISYLMIIFFVAIPLLIIVIFCTSCLSLFYINKYNLGGKKKACTSLIFSVILILFAIYLFSTISFDLF